MTSISDRLERLPFSRPHRRLLAMGGLGYSFDAMDGAVIAFVLPILTALWSLTSVETGVLASATYIGYLFGSFAAGTAGDLIGRRVVMMWALAIYSLASLASAFAESWPPFFWLRVIAGIGIGAESSIIAPYLAEFVAARYRGRFLGALAGFFSFGYVAAALLGYALVPAAPWGWQLVLVITALPIGMLLWWRRSLPESPRWLEIRGRHAEAAAVVDKLEAETRRAGDQPSSEPPQPATTGTSMDASPGVRPASIMTNLAALWSAGLARVTAMMWVTWAVFIFSYYSFFTWIPSLLVQSGLTVTRSFTYALAIYCAQIPGYFSGAYLNERIGRRATIVTGMLLGALSALALSFARSDAQVTISGVLLSLFMNMAAAGLYAYTPEVFPTFVRATGTGTASSIGRIGAISAPIFVGFIYPLYGFAGVFGMTTALLTIGALAILLFGPKTLGKPLEEIEQEELSADPKGVSSGVGKVA